MSRRCELRASYQELLSSRWHPIELEGNKEVVVAVTKAGELRVQFYRETPTPKTDAATVPLGKIALQPVTIILGYGTITKFATDL